MTHSEHDDDWLQETPEEHDRRKMLKLVAGFLGSLLFVAPLVVGLLPYVRGLFRRRVPADGGPGFDVRVASLDQVPADGQPRTFSVFGTERNVWNVMPNVKVGEVIVVREAAAGDEIGQLKVFSQVCPHLGCAVRAAPVSKPAEAAATAEKTGEEKTTDGKSTDEKAATESAAAAQTAMVFRCPCHDSIFELDGEKALPQAGKQNPSPRGLDELPPPAQTPKNSAGQSLTATNNAYVFADADGKQAVFIRYQEYFTGRAEKIAKDI